MEKVGLDYDTRSQRLKPPVIVDRSEAPVKQVVRKNEQVNLFEFPVPLPYHMEGGRTILGSIMTTVDNHGGNIYNCAYQTLRLISPRKVTVGLGEGTHNWERYRERVETTGEGLPAVAWIGHHPAACMGALTRVAIDVDEYSVIGGALGEPFRLTPSETWGDKFLVPADAEIVIEGIIPPKERGRHGLRADFARYYSPETLRPVMNIQAITYRRDAIYHDIHLGGRIRIISAASRSKDRFTAPLNNRCPRSKTSIAVLGLAAFTPTSRSRKPPPGRGEKRSSPLSGRPPGQARRGGRRGHQYL